MKGEGWQEAEGPEFSMGVRLEAWIPFHRIPPAPLAFAGQVMSGLPLGALELNSVNLWTVA